MRKLNDPIRQRIYDAFMVYARSGATEESLAALCAQHAIGLVMMADEHPDWFEKPDEPNKEKS